MKPQNTLTSPPFSPKKSTTNHHLFYHHRRRRRHHHFPVVWPDKKQALYGPNLLYGGVCGDANGGDRRILRRRSCDFR
ncbi:hypothetical protein HanRHA438_Chr15g0697751 [Helianthus annuus]|nr:hypothetical protein HanRHA438_Chr15g0697751 [Helianthus annuus]